MHETTTKPEASGTDKAPQQAPSRPERGFHEGEHIVLRPVLEADLPELAQLLAEQPYSHSPQPWTFQRLKQKFEDKEHPGLWQERERYFAIARKPGGVVGYIFEEDNDGHGGIYWNTFHLAETLEDRDALGRDVLATYFAYKKRWHNPLRICFSIGNMEQQKAQWLRDAGYELEVELPHACLYQGEPIAEAVYSWFDPYLLSKHDHGGPVAGEAGAEEPPGTANGGDHQRPAERE